MNGKWFNWLVRWISNRFGFSRPGVHWPAILNHDGLVEIMRWYRYDFNWIKLFKNQKSKIINTIFIDNYYNKLNSNMMIYWIIKSSNSNAI